MRGETPLLDEASCSITTQRFIIGNHTFVIANISSVRVEKIGAWRIPWVMAIGAGVFLLQNVEQRKYAIGIILIGALLLLMAKDEYVIILTSAGSEMKAFKSKDKSQAERIMEALNRAIVSR